MTVNRCCCASLCILAILLFLDRARIVIGDTLLLRPLGGSTPLVVRPPVGTEAVTIMRWLHCRERRRIDGRGRGQILRPLSQSNRHTEVRIGSYGHIG